MITVLRRRWEKNWPEISAACRGGMPEFVFSRHPRPLGDAVPVFVYHTVSHAGFAADLRFLRDNGYTPLGADALLDHLQGRRPAPARSVVLTFDDGAANLYRVAYPLLRYHSFRAVAFVAPRFHTLRTDGADDCGPRPCSWAEIREMSESGVVEFQSHTLEHRSLPHWPRPIPLTGVAARYHECRCTPLPLGEDLRRARAMLEDALGRPVHHLAFPRYDGTAAAVRIGRELGYRGFWWGLRPGRPLNRPGDDGTSIVRLSGEFVRRLPGRDRRPLGAILRARYLGAVRAWLR